MPLSSCLWTDRTPCISPLPQDGHLQDKGSPSLGLIQEETEVINSIMGKSVDKKYFSQYKCFLKPMHKDLIVRELHIYASIKDSHINTYMNKGHLCKNVKNYIINANIVNFWQEIE